MGNYRYKRPLTFGQKELIEQVKAQYLILADQYDGEFSMEGINPGITGDYGNRWFKIWSNLDYYLANDPTSSGAYIEVSCQLPKDYSLKLYREGLGDQLRKFFGMKDFEFGHKAFDQNFIVQSSRMDLTYEILDEKLRNMLLRDMGLISKFDIGPSRWSINFPKRKKKRKSSDEVLDLDFINELSKEDKEQQKEVNIRKKYRQADHIKTLFPHNVENTMKRGWLERLFETTVTLAENIEKAYPTP